MLLNDVRAGVRMCKFWSKSAVTRLTTAWFFFAFFFFVFFSAFRSAQLSSTLLGFVSVLHCMLNGVFLSPRNNPIYDDKTFQFWHTVGNLSFACAHAIRERASCARKFTKDLIFQLERKCIVLLRHAACIHTYSFSFFLNFNTKSLILNQGEEDGKNGIIVEISSGFLAVNCNVFIAEKLVQSSKMNCFFWWKNSIKKVFFCCSSEE